LYPGEALETIRQDVVAVTGRVRAMNQYERTKFGALELRKGEEALGIGREKRTEKEWTQDQTMATRVK